MLNALNEVLRDDFIKDSVGRRRAAGTRCIEKAGIALPPEGAAQGLQPPDRPAWPASSVARGQRVSAKPNGTRTSTEWLPSRSRPRLRRVADGPRRRARQVRELDRAAGDAASTGSRSTSSTCGSIEACVRRIATHGAARPRTCSIKQHLIDPEICIRCNTCEETCPVDAITHDARNYVVDADDCNACNACISPCPTGSDRQLAHGAARREPYTLEEQLGWDELPAQHERRDAGAQMPTTARRRRRAPSAAARRPQANAAVSPLPRAPWSAAHPYVNLYTLKKPAIATVAGNFRLTATDARERHPPHRARLRRARVPGARGPDDRHHPARTRRERPAAPPAPVLGREPARRRAPRLQQPRR